MLEKIQAISDPTRFAILQLVKNEELPAGEIATHFKSMTRPAVSQHLRVLKDKGLLSERREGTKRLYSVRSEGIKDIQEFLDQFWNSRLLKLKNVVERKEKENESRTKT